MKDMIITSITYRRSAMPGENRIFFDEAVVGRKNVVKIREHRAMGDGDCWYYDIEYKSGDVLRTFEVMDVMFKKVDVEKQKLIAEEIGRI